VFAYAVMKLVDKGTIDLDKPLATYLAGADLAQVYPAAAAGDPRWKAITARMVLTHSTGFPNWFNNTPMRFLFDPGERFSYSGEGYSLLAAAVTVATGRSFNQLLQELVFDPLGMSSSSYVWRPDYDTRITASHDTLGRPSVRGKATTPRAGASLYTTAGDYARFLVALGNGTGLTKAAWQAMTRAHIQVLDRGGKPCFSWGLGVGVHQSGADATLWHWGDNGDLNAYFEIVPKRRRGVVFFLNGANAHAVTPLLTERVLGLAVPAITTSYFRYPVLDSPAMAMSRAFGARGIAGAMEVAAKTPERFEAPDSPEIQRLMMLATIAVGRGDLTGSAAALDFVLARQPGFVPALVARGGIHLALGDRAAMEASFKKATAAQPDTETRINSLGYTLLRAGRVEDAIVVFEFNVRQYPQSANVYDSLAEAYEKKGDRQQAIRNYARALSMADPDPASSSYQALKRLLAEKQ
jgi:Flp pilus assembly protein TadD